MLQQVEMVDLLNTVLPTFIVIFIGYLLGKITKMNMPAIVDVVFYVELPALAFVSMLDKKIVLLDTAKIWAAATMIMFGCGIVAWLYSNMINKRRTINCVCNKPALCLTSKSTSD